VLNPWQAAKQLAYELEALVWPDGTGDPVIAAAKVTSRPNMDILRGLRTPFALIIPTISSPDPEVPGLVNATFDVVVLTAVRSDAFGEHSVAGGNRSGGQGSSEGRGAMELEEEIAAGITTVTEGLGQIRRVETGEIDQSQLAEHGYVAVTVLRVAEPCVRDRYYHPACNPAILAVSGSQVVVGWTLPPTRYDTLKIVVRRAAGYVPPAEVTDGDAVTLSAGDLAAFTIDSGVSASTTYSYSIFVAYDETGAGNEERYSDKITITETTTAAD
jgi:hypothetical protein